MNQDQEWRYAILDSFFGSLFIERDVSIRRMVETEGGKKIAKELQSIMELARESNNYIGESKKRDADIKKGNKTGEGESKWKLKI